jgi:FdhD protein
MPPNEASIVAPATRVAFAGGAAPVARPVPVEAAVGIVYAPTPYAVMMASPVDLEDFAYGFSLTEGVIERADDIRAVEVERVERGWRLVVTLAADRLRLQLSRARNMAGRTGCGVCGVEDLDALPFSPRRPRPGPPLALSAARRAIEGLDARLPLGDLTRATHGAAWCANSGVIEYVREDVGRHNALDKLIGALLRADVDPAGGFVLVTSRCSFEMVEKTAAFGARALVAVSAPTSLALERARAHGMTLLAVARADGALLFTDAAGVDNDLTLEGARSA